MTDKTIGKATETSFENHILTLTLNRPEKKNAINQEMAEELLLGFERARTDPEVRVVVVAARGDVFCAGGDLSMMAQQQAEGSKPFGGGIAEIALKVRGVCKPVIVKAQGPVLAGSLLIVCNATHVVAADDIYFSLPEIKRGLFPFMVMAGLLRLVPQRLALDWAMRGYKISAAEAKSWGLINQNVPREELDAAVDALAQEIASYSPATIRLGLEAFHGQENLSFEEAIPYLGEMLIKTLSTHDAQEGLVAFLEKRAPVWKGC